MYWLLRQWYLIRGIKLVWLESCRTEEFERDGKIGRTLNLQYCGFPWANAADFAAAHQNVIDGLRERFPGAKIGPHSIELECSCPPSTH